MIYTSDHAAQRFIKRSGSTKSILEVKKYISKSIVKFEPALQYFCGGTVPIKGTKLKAVVKLSDDNELVVATVITNTMYGGSLNNRRYK